MDGVDLANLDLAAMRRQIGVVMQAGQLVAGSILDNILGSAPLPEAAAWEAVAQVGLAADIKEMPMQLQTVVSEGGGGLSGGQRQRLLIARALVRKPRVLIFDEATSALDNATQAEVKASLDKLNVTRIVVAHRLSTIRDVHRIVVMDRGKVVEQGSYEELQQQNGLFARLASRQMA
jgi:ATP-binding cassette subfamily C protein